MAGRRVLCLTKYGESGASSRWRAYAYRPYLEERGWEVVIEPLLTDSYLESLYRTGRKSLREVARGLGRRASWLAKGETERFDVISVQYELFPHLPFVCEASFYRRFGKRIVVDYDDATFAMYMERAWLKDKISQVMAHSRLVLAGNSYLASYARRWTRHVALLPMAIDGKTYRPKGSYETGRMPVVGWVGTPVTSRELSQAADVFQRVAKETPFRLRCIGAAPGLAIPGVEVEVVRWSADREAEEIHGFDAGVMPLVENAFTVGKCGFKLLQYMGCGVPSVATRLGANSEIIRDGENGYLASSHEEFAEKLGALLRDRERREKLGRAGRTTVEQRYCLEVTGPRFCELLEEVAREAGVESRGDRVEKETTCASC